MTAIVVYANVMYSYQTSILNHNLGTYDTVCQTFVSLLNFDIMSFAFTTEWTDTNRYG